MSVRLIPVVLIALVTATACRERVVRSDPVVEPVARPRPLILAHRGQTLFAPENSLAAIADAIAAGADGVEIDLQLCGSGEVVVFHDDDLERMTGGDGRVAKMTLDALKTCRLRSVRGDERTHRIPTLVEVLDRFGGRTQLFLEMKTPRRRDGAVAMARRTAEAIRARELEASTFVSSLTFEHIDWVAKRYPTIRTVYEFFDHDAWQEKPAELPGTPPHVRWAGPALQSLDRGFARWAHGHFEGVSTFTALSLADVRRANAAGADLIQTDIPRLAVLWRDGRLSPDAVTGRPTRKPLATPVTDATGGGDRLPWVAVATRPGGIYAVEMVARTSAATPKTHGLLLAVDDEGEASDGVARADDIAEWIARRRHTIGQQFSKKDGVFATTLVHRAGTGRIRIVYGLASARGFHVDSLRIRVVEE